MNVYRTGGMMRAEVSKRLVSGTMVPLDVDTPIGDGVVDLERFERPAFAHQYRAPNRVWLRVGHSNVPHSYVLGAGRVLTDTDDGLWGEFKVVESDRGDEWLAMAGDPEFDLQWSLGFTPLRYRQDGRVTVYQRVQAFEMAFVPQGAYGPAAMVSAVRDGTPVRLLDSLPPLPRLRPLP